MVGDESVAVAQRFELRDKLGEGGMGVVYRAFDRALGKEIALKRMRGVGAGDVLTLKAEFRARAAVQHKGIVQLYELVVDGDDCFLTMELVDGTDLVSWVRGGAAPAPDRAAPVSRMTVREGRGAGGSPREPVAQAAPPLDAAGVARLRAALVELCNALVVLHDAGVVHRDLTPANVRVAPDGRVVVLDFGLAGSVAAERPGSDEWIIGTPVYMAPEQARAEPMTAAVDMYALGAILYELLSGRHPFEGSDSLVRMSKASGARPEPLVDTVDPGLAALAMALLDPSPATRPTARAVVHRLAGELPPAAPVFGLPGPGVFFGRRAEVATLRRALAQVVEDRRPRAVIVEGPSGIGKSSLLRQFAAELPGADGELVVLSSRCHPQELVPFKAIDAAVDALAELATGRSDLGTFEPALVQAAVRLFPALSIIPELEGAPASDVARDDPDVRAQGFEALRTLLARVAARGPVVLVIDDVQWDDTDSLAALEAVLRGRGAPPVLLLLGLRSASGDSAIVRRLTGPVPLVPVDRLELGPLPTDDVARLAAVFLGDGDPRIQGVVDQSEGNPFLVCELARYLAARPRESSVRDVDVKELVAARLRELAPAERAALDVVALAVRPLAVASALEAAGLGADAHTAVLALRDALLIRHAADTIAPYHDKIAEATRQLLSADAAAAIHRALAETIERREPGDFDALCVHWEGAGATARAAECAYHAAGNAAAMLAFGRAAELYEKALALRFEGVDRAELLDRAAGAHASHGRGPRAARRYLDASRELGDDIASARVRTLKRLAAEQFVKSGYVTQGWEVMRSVLDAAGIPQPSSPARATLGALGRRARFLARRIDVDRIGDRRIPDDERPRLEILWTASTSMSMIDVTLSDAFRTQHLGRILDVGDASSIARALAYEVALEAHVGGRLLDWHAERLLGYARRLVDRTGDPYDRAWLELGVANQAYCAGRFADAAAACRRSETILREQCTGVAWEISTVAAFLLTSIAMLGDLRGLRDAAERFTADAERRGDLFSVAEGCSGECALAWWTMGSGDAALARAREAVARQGGDAQRWPEKTYRRGQMTEAMAVVHLALLAGDPWPAWQAMLANWDGMKSAMIPSLQFYRSWVRHGRARAALAAAETGGERDGWTRDRLRADAAKLAREMAKDRRPFGAPWAALIEGALADDGARRVQALERAVAGFDAAGMALYREAARWRLGAVTGSTERRERADAWLRDQGVPDTQALVNALAPGY